MTRKDFQLIADVIRGLRDVIDEDNRAKVADAFSSALPATNARFKPERFLNACDLDRDRQKVAAVLAKLKKTNN